MERTSSASASFSSVLSSKLVKPRPENERVTPSRRSSQQPSRARTYDSAATGKLFRYSTSPPPARRSSAIWVGLETLLRRETATRSDQSPLVSAETTGASRELALRILYLSCSKTVRVAANILLKLLSCRLVRQRVDSGCKGPRYSCRSLPHSCRLSPHCHPLCPMQQAPCLRTPQTSFFEEPD